MNYSASFAKSSILESHCPTCRLPVGGSPRSNPKRRLVEKLVLLFDPTPVVVVALLLSGTIAGALEFMTHLAVARLHTPLAYHAFIDAGVIALMTMALLGVCIASSRARRQAMVQQTRTVEQLHHHLRNALQVIAQSRFLPEDKRAQAVFDSMDRINDVLGRLAQK